MATNDQGKAPINIIKKKKSAHVAHGGAWKVAYADFVTAMMALFIVLWIIGQNKQIKESVAHYFRNPTVNEKILSAVRTGGLVSVTNNSIDRLGLPVSGEAQELKTLRDEGRKLQSMIDSTEEFKEFTNQIKITVSKEGLRIELIENSEGLFFDVGSAKLKATTDELLKMIAKELSSLPNKIIIEGYTDARPYVRSDYTNWELSSDRANAARKVLDEGGLNKDQILEVRGYADRRLRNPADPYDFSNRRVSILVTTLQADSIAAAIGHIDTVKVGK